MSAGDEQTRRRDGFDLEVDEATSQRMAGIRQKDTKPELIVRRILTELGLRYRLTNRDLPGSPDIANRSRRWAIFVHGCYWHRHGCRHTTTPKRNTAFWEAKFRRNVERDRHAQEQMRRLGYEALTIWECETRGTANLARERLSSWASRTVFESKAP